jgi:hypothetical protein
VRMPRAPFRIAMVTFGFAFAEHRYSPPEDLVMPEKTPRAPLPLLAITLSPFAWFYGRPDLFDSYRCRTAHTTIHSPAHSRLPPIAQRPCPPGERRYHPLPTQHQQGLLAAMADQAALLQSQSAGSMVLMVDWSSRSYLKGYRLYGACCCAAAAIYRRQWAGRSCISGASVSES